MSDSIVEKLENLSVTAEAGKVPVKKTTLAEKTYDKNALKERLKILGRDPEQSKPVPKQKHKSM